MLPPGTITQMCALRAAETEGGNPRKSARRAGSIPSVRRSCSLVVARACWWTHLHNVAPIPIASGISMHSDGRSCACTLGVSPASLFVLHARARERARILVRTRAAGSADGRTRVGRGGGRGTSDYRAREPLLAPGACVQIEQPPYLPPPPPPSSPCNPPGFTFPGTPPPGDTVEFQRVRYPGTLAFALRADVAAHNSSLHAPPSADPSSKNREGRFRVLNARDQLRQGPPLLR